MSDLGNSNLHPGRKKRHAAHQHSIRGSNRAGFESGGGFEARNRIVVRSSLCACICHGIAQCVPGEYRSVCPGGARWKLTHPRSAGCERK
jgi:hypothetical protein